MASFLSLTNSVLARLNEVQLTSSNFSNARGIQVQAKNAVNESIRYINQREFQYPFNHTTKTQTLSPGIVRYSIPTDAKHVDYNTARIVKNSTLGASGANLSILQYNDYINRESVTQEDEIVTTTLAEELDASETEIDLTSSTGFDSAGTVFIDNEQITYTGISTNTLTGCTRGTAAPSYGATPVSTTAAAHTSGAKIYGSYTITKIDETRVDDAGTTVTFSNKFSFTLVNAATSIATGGGFFVFGGPVNDRS